MIKRSFELDRERIMGLKNGEGYVDLTNILSKDEMSGCGRLFAHNQIPPQSSIGFHTHEGDFETYFIIKGRAEVKDGNQVCEIGAGDVMICEDGASHSIRNIGEEMLEYIALILYSSH